MNTVSNKIDSLPLETANRAASAVAGTAAVSGRKSDAITSAPEGDSVKLTGQAHSLSRIEQELRSSGAIDSQRVEAVRQAMAAGTFRIDSGVIAGRLIELERMLDG